MDMDKNNGSTTGGSVTSERRGGDIVPVPPPSTSSDGPSGELPAGSPGDMASAESQTRISALRARFRTLNLDPTDADKVIPAEWPDIEDEQAETDDIESFYEEYEVPQIDGTVVTYFDHKALAKCARKTAEDLESLRKSKCRKLGGPERKELHEQNTKVAQIMEEVIRRVNFNQDMWVKHQNRGWMWMSIARRMHQACEEMIREIIKVEDRSSKAEEEVADLCARLHELEGTSWNLPGMKMEEDPPASRRMLDVATTTDRLMVKNVATETDPIRGHVAYVPPVDEQREERTRVGRTHQKKKRRVKPPEVAPDVRSQQQRRAPIPGQYEEETEHDGPPSRRREPPIRGTEVPPQRDPPWRTVPPRRRQRGEGRRPPPRAVVAIRVGDTPGGTPPSYADILRDARGKIPLKDLGIVETSIRRAADGGLLVEVRDQVEGGAKADALAERFRSLLPNASISRPVRLGRIRLVGFDESVLPCDIQEALAACTNCRPSDIRVGLVFRSQRGFGAVTIRLPMEAAEAAAVVGKVALGWSVARIELRADGPLQCHRCWRYGHVRAGCSGVDRSSSCYNCGRSGHAARDCVESAACVVCEERGWGARHRMGGPSCRVSQEARAAGPSRRRGRWTRGRPPALEEGGISSGGADGAWITGGLRLRSPAQIPVPRVDEAMEGVVQAELVRETSPPLSPRASKRPKRGGE